LVSLLHERRAMVKPWLVVLVSAASACASHPDLVNGRFAGQPLSIRSAVSAAVTDPTAEDMAFILMTTNTDPKSVCDELLASKEGRPFDDVVEIHLEDIVGRSTAPPSAPGTYTIGATAMVAGAFVGRCGAPPLGLEATSGTVHLTQIVGDHFAGDFDIVVDGEHVTGTFDPLACPGSSLPGITCN
jgi:hypothetical protein